MSCGRPLRDLSLQYHDPCSNLQDCVLKIFAGFLI